MRLAIERYDRHRKKTIVMTLKELEDQLLALTAIEKAEALQLLMPSIGGSRGITKTPGVCGGEACIGNTRIPVWLLVEARQLGISEARLLEDYPHIGAADLVNAWAYAEAHSDEIALAIRQNQEA